MSDVVIYHNPRCSKSRQTLKLLEDNDIQPEVRLYLEKPPSAAELKKLLKALDLSARDLLRKGEAEYKELGLADTNLSEAKLIAAMVEHPRLIERPVVVRNGKAVLGRPPENVLTLM
jgi:arsenate reductase